MPKHTIDVYDRTELISVLSSDQYAAKQMACLPEAAGKIKRSKYFFREQASNDAELGSTQLWHPQEPTKMSLTDGRLAAACKIAENFPD